jgi:hypothetical protein
LGWARNRGRPSGLSTSAALATLSAAALVPWYLTIFWYAAPAAIGGRIPALWAHILYSVVITFAGGVVAEVTEQTVLAAEERRRDSGADTLPGFGVTVLVVVTVLVFLGIAFSRGAPYIDVFEIPNY